MGHRFILCLAMTSLLHATGCESPGPPPAATGPSTPPPEPPTIVSAMISGDNASLDITYSEGVFLQPPPHGGEFIFSPSGGTATDVRVVSATDRDGNLLSGGEETIAFRLSVIGIPSGAETIEVIPRDSIRDAEGNIMTPWILAPILAGICVVLFVCWACLAVGAEDFEVDRAHPPSSP